MKLSQLSTEKARDVIVELTPHVESIAADERLSKELLKFAEIPEEKKQTKMQLLQIWVSAICKFLPYLLKDKAENLYSILSVMNEMTVDEIKEQNIMKTLAMAKDVFSDEDFFVFFKSFVPIKLKK